MFRKDEDGKVFIEIPKVGNIFKKLNNYDDAFDIFMKSLVGVIAIGGGLLIVLLLIAGITALGGYMGWWVIILIISIPFIGYGLYWVGNKITP